MEVNFKINGKQFRGLYIFLFINLMLLGINTIYD